MATVKQLNQVLLESNSLKYIAQAYTEVSANKLKKIRAGIERNRVFYGELTEVLQVVRSSAAKKGIYSPPKPKSRISLLLTSNYRFCGSIESQLMKAFITASTKLQGEMIIIGKTGNEYLKEIGFLPNYQSLIFQKDLPNPQELRRLVAIMGEYNQALVFHSQMHSIMVQKPYLTDIAQRQISSQMNKAVDLLDYIFEPEIGTILTFFENQITGLLLEQAFLEAELARTAARMVSMDQAQLNADKLILDQKLLLAQAKRSQINMQLLESAASLLKWRKEINIY